MAVFIDILNSLKQALQANVIPFRCGTTKRIARILVTYAGADTDQAAELSLSNSRRNSHAVAVMSKPVGLPFKLASLKGPSAPS